jgi:hypothetical protein
MQIFQEAEDSRDNANLYPAIEAMLEESPIMDPSSLYRYGLEFLRGKLILLSNGLSSRYHFCGTFTLV